MLTLIVAMLYAKLGYNSHADVGGWLFFAIAGDVLIMQSVFEFLS